MNKIRNLLAPRLGVFVLIGFFSLSVVRIQVPWCYKYMPSWAKPLVQIGLFAPGMCIDDGDCPKYGSCDTFLHQCKCDYFGDGATCGKCIYGDDAAENGPAEICDQAGNCWEENREWCDSAPPPPSPPTATSTPVPTVTPVPTSTPVPPTATQPAPTATQPAPTATQPAPTATQPATASPPAPGNGVGTVGPVIQATPLPQKVECLTLTEWKEADTHWAADEINWALEKGFLEPELFEGESEPKFCAGNFLQRETVASSFIAILGEDGSLILPERPAGFTTDVPTTHPFAVEIEEFVSQRQGFYPQVFWFKPAGLPSNDFFGPERFVTLGELAEWLRMLVLGPETEPGPFERIFALDSQMFPSYKFARSLEDLERLAIYDRDIGPDKVNPNRFMRLDQYAVLLYRAYTVRDVLSLVP